jgi:hypothetical protein
VLTLIVLRFLYYFPKTYFVAGGHYAILLSHTSTTCKPFPLSLSDIIFKGGGVSEVMLFLRSRPDPRLYQGVCKDLTGEGRTKGVGG